MEKILETVGLGIPFYFAAATYGVFHWLDNNASDEAMRAISQWLKGRPYRKIDVGNAIINAFDRIYTVPLLGFRAFLRSATISICIWLLLVFLPFFSSSIVMLLSDLLFEAGMENGWWLFLFWFITTLSTVFSIVLSDYFSLFIVRHFLFLARAHPMRSSLLASLAGFVIVIIVWELFFTIAAVLVGDKEIYDILMSSISAFFRLMLPALVIHLWLPLLVVASLGVRVVFVIFRAVEWAQWFLKQGDQHPIRAIGVVATVLVFVGVALAKEAWTIL